MIKPFVPHQKSDKSGNSNFRLSDIKEKCMHECVEEQALIKTIKSRIAHELYLEYFDIFNNSNNIEDTKATRMVIDIQRILLDWNLEITDDLDAFKVIEKIMEIYKKNDIFIANDFAFRF